MAVIEIKVGDIFPDEQFLGSRYSGEIIRKQLELVFENDDTIAVVDFEGVTGTTQGFLDEVIGIFIRAYGFDMVKNRIKIINANETLKVIANFVASYSKKTYQEDKLTLPNIDVNKGHGRVEQGTD